MDRITLDAENFSPSRDGLGVFIGPMNKNGAIGLQGGLFHPFAKSSHIYIRKYNPITNQSS